MTEEENILEFLARVSIGEEIDTVLKDMNSKMGKTEKNVNQLYLSQLKLIRIEKKSHLVMNCTLKNFFEEVPNKKVYWIRHLLDSLQMDIELEEMQKVKIKIRDTSQIAFEQKRYGFYTLWDIIYIPQKKKIGYITESGNFYNRASLIVLDLALIH